MAADASWVWQSPRPPRCSSLLALKNAHGKPQSCMRISLGMCRSRRGEAVALPNCIRQKRRCMSSVTAIVRTASRHGPRVVVADQCDHTASPDRLHPSRYSFFVAVCMVSLSEKSQHCVSVCVEYMQCMLAKWLILSLALSFGISLDRSRICADRIARFRFSSCVRANNDLHEA